MNQIISVGVAVLLLNQQNDILMAKRLNNVGKGTWGHPGGHLEPGETFEQCAIREIYEEIGITITNPQFFALVNTIFEGENGRQGVTVFMTALYPPQAVFENKEPHKCSDIRWFSQDNLPTPLFLPVQLLLTGKGYGYANDHIIMSNSL